MKTYAGFMVGCVMLDQGVKWSFSEPPLRLGPLVLGEPTLNPGVFLGLVNGPNLLFLLFIVFFLTVLFYWFFKHKELRVALTFLIAGFTSILFDRMLYGAGLDVIKLLFLPQVVFNLADAYALLGSFLSCMVAIKHTRKKWRKD